MSFSAIFAMAVRGMLPSLIFAVMLYGLYYWKIKKTNAAVFLFLFYLCMLFYVTVYRYGITLDAMFSQRPDGNMQPLLLTLALWKNDGFLILLYNVIGNIVWFIPLGFFLAYLREHLPIWRIMVYSFACSSAIEILQYLLNVGITDIDDVLFNVIGGCIGGCCVIFIRFLRSLKHGGG